VRFWLLWSLIAGLGAVVAVTVGGSTAGQGYAMGLGGTAFSVLALKWIIGTMANAATGIKPGLGTLWVVLAFFVKLPVFVTLAMASHRVGGDAPTGFAAGILLVYSALVGWAVRREQSPP